MSALVIVALVLAFGLGVFSGVAFSIWVFVARMEPSACASLLALPAPSRLRGKENKHG